MNKRELIPWHIINTALMVLFMVASTWVIATPCKAEDSPMCTWNGSTQGNKTGANVYNLIGPYYITLGA